MIPFGRPVTGIDEIEAVKTVLESGVFVHGQQTHQFEAEFATFVGVRNAVAVSSCTAGLHLALFSRGIREGQKVAVPAMTHVATAHVVELLGATPVFVDVDHRSGNMSAEELSRIADQGLDAVMPVHYLGLPCDMEEINRIARSAGAIVIEDCALALGATYGGRSAGALGDGASFSFYPVKHMTSIEGGMFTTDDDDFAEAVRKRRAFGYNRDLSQRSRPGMYDVDALGFNYRMNEIEAAVGRVQLTRMGTWLEERKRNFSVIETALRDFPSITVFPTMYGKALSSHYCINLILSKDEVSLRDGLQDILVSRGVGSSIHYPSAVPLFSYYRKKYGYSPGQFPVAEWIARGVLSLPVGPHLGHEGAERVAEAVSSALMDVLG